MVCKMTFFSSIELVMLFAGVLDCLLCLLSGREVYGQFNKPLGSFVKNNTMHSVLGRNSYNKSFTTRWDLNLNFEILIFSFLFRCTTTGGAQAMPALGTEPLADRVGCRVDGPHTFYAHPSRTHPGR